MTANSTQAQEALLEKAVQAFIKKEEPLSKSVQEAFMAVPRHRFVKKFYNPTLEKWIDVNETTLEENLSLLYGDHPLPLDLGETTGGPSTISQPSFVLRMLDLLDLQPGQIVFELGAGSGWNAALIGHLIGKIGSVYSIEIIPNIAVAAQQNIQEINMDHVHIIKGDGSAGYPPGAPYDRATFTAGATDLPELFFDQIKDGGKILLIFRIPGGGDTLYILNKVGDSFVSVYSMACGFVPMTGASRSAAIKRINVSEIDNWQALKGSRKSRRIFWHRSTLSKKDTRHYKTRDIRFYLSIAEPDFQLFMDDSSEEFHKKIFSDFGVWHREEESLTVVRPPQIMTYGDDGSKRTLYKHLRDWAKLGKPQPENFSLKIVKPEHTKNSKTSTSAKEWIVSRPNATFIFSLQS